MTLRTLRPGELFILGFRGTEIPSWLTDFEREHGLGGVILFDYNCQSRAYSNNVESPAQVRDLCARISAMPSRPLITVDQEGGKVRRLKEKLGFAPLPSAKAFNLLDEDERERVAEASFREMRELGFHYDLTPVIDIDYNPENPDIGKVERSYSARAEEVRRCAGAVDRAARRAGLGLCLKHFPGLGGAKVNSHEELTDISGAFAPEQLELFYSLGRTIHGGAVLVSHGIVREWDSRLPVSMSPAGIGRLRQELPDALLLSDDLQMQGLQRAFGTSTPTREATLQGLRSGLDLIVIGNNLMAEDERCLEYARAVREAAERDPAFAERCLDAQGRVDARKKLFARI